MGLNTFETDGRDAREIAAIMLGYGEAGDEMLHYKLVLRLDRYSKLMSWVNCEIDPSAIATIIINFEESLLPQHQRL